MNQNLLNLYKKHSIYTDPGELEYLYKDLPDDLESLCKVIKSQLIHPVQRKNFRNELIEHTSREDNDFSTVSDMLEALMIRNPEGLTMKREPDERLILSCRFHALLLTSILRSRGIPARVRAGFAQYLNDVGKYNDHWICEAWDLINQKWITVDADLQMLNVENQGFVYANDAWLMAQNNIVNPKLFGVKKWWGLYYIRNNLCLDLNCILGKELRYGELPKLCQKEMKLMNFDELQLLDELAFYLQDIDEYYEMIQTLYKDYSFFHYSER